MKKVIIFGTGQLGEIAYKYYCKKYEIAYFVDNNQKKWDTLFYNLPIINPEILKDEKNFMVIVPDGIYKKEMCEQLYAYGVKEVLLFTLSEKIYTPYIQTHITEEEEIIVKYKGGLGNQLFQYAFMRYLMLVYEKKCSADLSAYMYPYGMKYVLQDVFPKIKIARCNPYKRESYITNEKLCYFEKEFVRSAFESIIYFNIEQKTAGYLTGYFQSSIFVEKIKEELYGELIFNKSNDKGIKKYSELFKLNNTVSVHIRRGDYMLEDNKKIFGNICNREYYLRAIDFLKKILINPTFVFFSNDMDWVKVNFSVDNAIYIEQREFDDYQDWYDMYLMSICKNNIIANSTFSWWGAWLNRNNEKIVIAPKKWMNQEALLDVCPKEWIRI